MNYKEYKIESAKTFAESNDKTLDLLHCAIGASTETGELLDAFKKHIYYKKELDIVNIGEEIADIQWYLVNLCRLLDLDMEKLLDTNIAKLRARYGEKFSEEKALNRDLNTERNILEGNNSSENRDLSTGGMKPPKREWLSYSENNLTDKDVERLKIEIKNKAEKGEVLDEISVFNLSDVSEIFGYLEDYQEGDFSVKILDTEELIEREFSTIFNTDKLKNLDSIAVVFTFFSGRSLSLCFDFDKLNGILSINKDYLERLKSADIQSTKVPIMLGVEQFIKTNNIEII